MKVLLIAYHFPPANTVGVQRTLRFSRSLTEQGCQVHVLTVEPEYYPARAEESWQAIPARVTVHRTRAWQPLLTAHRVVRSVVRPSLWQRLRRLRAWGRFLFTAPDPQVGWWPFACLVGLGLICRTGMDVLYTTSPPHSAHLIGWTLQRLTGRPWVADFRDAWTTNPLWRARDSSPLRQRWERKLEHAVLRAANRVITNTETLKETFLCLYPNLPPDKLVPLMNGFDRADFAVPLPPKDEDRFTLVYAGTINLSPDPAYPPVYRLDPFLGALGELTVARPELQRRLRVVLLGPLAQGGEAELAALVENCGVAALVEYRGQTSHAEAVRHLLRADALLLVHYDGPGGEAWVPAKTFEYLATGKPILALLPPRGDLYRLLRDQPQVFLASNQPTAIRPALERLLQQADRLPLCCDRRLGYWERKRQGEQFYRILVEVCSRESA